MDAVRSASEAKKIRLYSSLDAKTGPVSGDPDRLQQVVWNLLSNAIKFTPEGGRVEVRIERTETNIEIVVTDTGVGISQDFLPYVFDRFRQADSSSTRAHGSLGLGLAIVRHLVELHGGTVLVESPGDGQEPLLGAAAFNDDARRRASQIGSVAPRRQKRSALSAPAHA
ncbi:MAG: ATP-binding protein [Pyrinomonadaceae bacterium]